MAALDEEAEGSGLPWRLAAGAVVERYPLIYKEPPEWYTEFERVSDMVDAKRREIFREHYGYAGEYEEDDITSLDEMMETQLPFQPAPRTTPDDEADNRRSLTRCLDESLFLLVRRKRKQQSWQFPQGKIREDETVLQASERILRRSVGPNMKFFFWSNAPLVYWAYKYPPKLQEKRGQFGAKLFLLRAQLLEGPPPAINPKIFRDMAWATNGHLDEYIEDKDFVKTLKWVL